MLNEDLSKLVKLWSWELGTWDVIISKDLSGNIQEEVAKIRRTISDFPQECLSALILLIYYVAYIYLLFDYILIISTTANESSMSLRIECHG